LRISGRHKDASVAIDNRFRQTADARRDDGLAGGHRLERGDPQSFKERRHDYQIDARQKFRRVGDETQKARFGVNPEPLRLIFQLAAQRTVAGKAILQFQSS